MARSATSFQPGKSGNPQGRPPKNRALTAILERAGAKTVDLDGHKVSRKRVIAELAWQIATTGKARFPDGATLVLEPRDWFDTVKWLYSHIDGPAKEVKDVTLKGDPANPVGVQIYLPERKAAK